MLEACIPILRALGVDIDWHMLWVSQSDFWSDAKRIYNSLLGVPTNSPLWKAYAKVNDENDKLYQQLRNQNAIFFFDDPQPCGMSIYPDDIAILHIDTYGTRSEIGSGTWKKLSEHWAKVWFLRRRS